MKRLIIVACALLLLASCSAFKSYGVTDYYPLKKDAAWTYRVTVFEHSAQGDSVVSTVRVVDEKDGTFTVRQGAETNSFVHSDQGFQRTKGGTFILKEPVEKDAAWEIEVTGDGMTLKGKACITEKGVTATVIGKTFEQCIVVVEAYEKIWRRVATYCPGVGLVREEFFETVKGADKLIRRAELLAHQDAGE